MNRRDETLVNKLLAYCDEVEASHRFFNDDKALFCDKARGFVYRNAIAMPILQIGELAKNLSEEFRQTHTEIPWRAVTRMRDLLAHRYGTMDYEQTWNTSHESIMELKRFLLKVRQENNPENPQ